MAINAEALQDILRRAQNGEDLKQLAQEAETTLAESNQSRVLAAMDKKDREAFLSGLAKAQEAGKGLDLKVGWHAGSAKKTKATAEPKVEAQATKAEPKPVPTKRK